MVAAHLIELDRRLDLACLALYPIDMDVGTARANTTAVARRSRAGTPFD
jgi:hypothetical protein